ncbi:MAG: ATP-binding cassette domain-containing protein [Oligoflexia bacterium]|nr:ATP-binding cassette domain-containing protein [Oligoflexia bacterium]
MLDAQHISHSFDGHAVLRGVDLRLGAGELVGLIGPSGGGKSVLLKILGNVLQATGGALRVDTESRSLMFQEGALFDSLTVFDNVAFPLVGGRVPLYTQPEDIQEQVRAKVSEILARVGLTKAAFKIPAQLSGGMRRRVSLARALVARPSVLLLDDPTAGLDPVASSVIMNLIVEMYNEYKPATLIVSHDLRRLLPIVQRVAALFDGSICFDGALDELAVFRHPHVQTFVRCRYEFA